MNLASAGGLRFALLLALAIGVILSYIRTKGGDRKHDKAYTARHGKWLHTSSLPMARYMGKRTLSPLRIGLWCV